jgi:nicotinamidase-related amidase
MAAHELLRDLSEKVDPSRAVVLTIDVQNDFFHDQGYMGRLGVPLSAIQGMVPPLQTFLAAARRAEVPVMHVVSHHDEQYASPVVTEQKLRNGHDLTAHDPHGDGRAMKDAAYCRQGTFGVEQYEIQALPGEEIIVKHRYNAFHGTGLDQLLRARGAQTVIVTGAGSNACVESTAREVYSHDYYLVFLSDCTATTSDAAHQNTLATIDMFFGQVASSDEVIGAWTDAARPGAAAG